MRVAHLIHSLEPGGAEALLVDLARVAPDAGLQIAVMPLVRTVDDRYVRALRELDVPVFGLDLPNRWDPRAFRAALGTLRRWRPDIVHTHLKHADLIGAAASRSLGAPMVSTLHVIEDGRTPMLRMKRRLAATARLSTASRTITVSDAQRRWYLGAFPSAAPRRIITVHNGVTDPRTRDTPPRDRAEMRAELGFAPSDVVAVQVAVVRAGKGHACLLEAARRLPADSPVRIVVAGDGPLRAELEEQAARLELGDRVRFLGYRDDVPDLLGACDLVVHPSEFEALPTALLEAQAAGRPVVTTRVGGIPEIVTDEPGEAVGMFVPVGDADALSEALAGLGADPQRRAALGEQARASFESRFDARVWARRLGSVYDDVTKEEEPACPAR